MRRVLALLRVLVIVVIAVLAVLAPTAALAQDEDAGQVGLSMDGVRWQATLTEPLFDPRVRWVPGDVRTSRFLVRNESRDPADLTVEILRVRRDALLETAWLEIAARSGSGRWTRVTEDGRHQLVSTDDVRAGDVVPVQVRVSLRPGAPNGTQVLATELDLRVTLVDSRAVGPDDGADGPDGVLPDTGLVVPWWFVPLALAFVAIGLLLLLAGRRRTEPDPEPDPETDVAAPLRARTSEMQEN